MDYPAISTQILDTDPHDVSQQTMQDQGTWQLLLENLIEPEDSISHSKQFISQYSHPVQAARKLTLSMQYTSLPGHFLNSKARFGSFTPSGCM